MQPDPGATTRRPRLRPALSRAEWHAVLGMAGFVALLHLLGWGVLAGVVAPAHYDVGPGQVFGLGLGLTAYTLGMRHAFDADHIAAIDATTRKLLADGRRPLSVGFWFSLGHSTIVLVLVALLSLGVRAVAGQLTDDTSDLQQVGRLFGTAVSGTFLYLIGILNLVVLVGIARVYRRMRAGTFDEAALEQQLAGRGLLNRFLGRLTRTVTRPGQMYPVGVLFGLGFDTVTEVGLLVLAGGAAASSLPWYAVLTLPVLFAAGMSLLDTADGCFMNVAYGWAFSSPVRKVYYNLVVTGLSVAVALGIGTAELASILVQRGAVSRGPLAALGALDLDTVGFVVAGLFVAVWLVAASVWKVGRVEQRWGARLS